VLLELCFLTHDGDLEFCLSDDYPDIMSSALVLGFSAAPSIFRGR
jgi:hypothetical protein